MENQIINEETRKVYHEQHTRVANNEVAMRRFLNMIQEDYFGLGQGFFHGKKILDAGCGDTAKLLIRFSQFGASELVGLDLGEDFIPVAKASIKKNGVDSSKVRFISGSVDALPFEDGEFDFVCCHGVLLHLANIEQVQVAFSELARVTKKGGWLYTVYGLHGGLFEAIYPAIRAYYRENIDFKNLIDNISPENFDDVFTFIERESKDNGLSLNLDRDRVKALFDTDLCVTIQNIIQAPVRLPISEEFVLDQYNTHGFGAPRRLKRFVQRENIRQYFAPLHFVQDHPISKILYGSGNLEFIAKKL